MRRLADKLDISDIQSDNTEQHIHESRQLFVHNPTGRLPDPAAGRDGAFQHIPNQAVLGAESHWERLIPLLKTTADIIPSP
ncbi:hypothetical protein [Morganella morganii]|uniref:hypothetical protein n=1 Tax=Morganella morganii TaxID=582 RepID=UPI001D10B792|nr:hypothetical protein [Morganella morganii]